MLYYYYFNVEIKLFLFIGFIGVCVNDVGTDDIFGSLLHLAALVNQRRDVALGKDES